MTIKLGSLFEGGGVRLAPDLNYPTDKASDASTIKTISGINAVGSLTTALSLSGEFVVTYLEFKNMTAENVSVRLTIDSVVIWDSSRTLTTTSLVLLGQSNFPESIFVSSSLLLEVQTATDNNIDLDFLARPKI